MAGKKKKKGKKGKPRVLNSFENLGKEMGLGKASQRSGKPASRKNRGNPRGSTGGPHSGARRSAGQRTSRPPGNPPKPPNAPSHPGLYYYKGVPYPDNPNRRDLGQRLVTQPIQQIMGLDAPLLQAKIQGIPYLAYFQMRSDQGFELETCYPGLLIGTGYAHPIPADSTEDFQMGFTFDWTTGIPFIPGSTVKGVLRAVFLERDDPEKQEEVSKYVIEKLDMQTNSESADAQKNLLEELEAALFTESKVVFYDAYVSGLPSGGKLFAEDYVTPHKSAFSDPVPLRFLKIAPEVRFTFQFRLQDLWVNGIDIKTDNVLALFKAILMDFGVGAKRNTGYGGLMEENPQGRQ